MPPLDHVLAFSIAAFLIIIIPGPSVLFVIGRSIAFGRRVGVLSVLGNALGTLPAVLLVAFGVGAIVASSVVAFTIIKFAGALYLAWLGIQAIRHRNAHMATVPREPAGTWAVLGQGFIVGLTNPKTIAFFVAVLPQFVDPAAGAVWLQLLLLGLIFEVIAVASDGTWALAAGSARHWFARSPKRLSNLTATGGVMMIGLGGALAFTGSKS
ncbi:threonine/homoserine/homoserine lactone efflux protein [Microbacterium endophyticum]|uniref:Threonine/homoserine/homoserine lactone efflux protein n=1 Tax=Microbacterium endophyticum TaxID=1526412 RepID=A0A7W4V5I0_9MICO|nr:LysE family translocator [Microbacterium endophyticum]MBB2976879.1 threonine/homoserine/homoserine lactone efflux protein [Microbacterium endophyticum]NIK35803.1 threonine/homoserine/homoserine lactone efflux protein [Microbacterium endophyticum]